MLTALAILISAQNTIQVYSGPDSAPEYVGVDLRASNMPIRQALSAIGRQVPNVRFDVAREVQGNINAWFINLPYDKALGRLSGQAGAQFTTLLEAKPDPKRPNANMATIQKVVVWPTYTEKITFHSQDFDIRRCLRTIFGQTKHSYTVDVNLRGNVTVKCEDEGLISALSKTLAPVGGAFRIEGGIFNFYSTLNPTSDEAMQRRPISLAADKERRQTLLSRFARQAGITLELEGSVNLGDRVTFKSEGQSVAEVLRAILGNKHRFFLREGVVVVTPGQPG